VGWGVNTVSDASQTLSEEKVDREPNSCTELIRSDMQACVVCASFSASAWPRAASINRPGLARIAAGESPHDYSAFYSCSPSPPQPLPFPRPWLPFLKRLPVFRLVAAGRRGRGKGRILSRPLGRRRAEREIESMLFLRCLPLPTHRARTINVPCSLLK
jgi:hypothetical protein